MLTLHKKGIEEYALEKTEPQEALLDGLVKETHDHMELPQMLCGPIEGQLLKQIVMISGARRIIEVGTFTGYSALRLAEGLPEDGELFTCDINPESLAMARRYFEKSKHGKKIKIVEGPALETIPTIEGSFDLAFIDADKVNYRNYYEAILPRLKKGGIVLVDNVLWGGSVIDESKNDESTRAIKEFNEHISQDERVEKVLLTVRDGLYFMVKR